MSSDAFAEGPDCQITFKGKTYTGTFRAEVKNNKVYLDGVLHPDFLGVADEIKTPMTSKEALNALLAYLKNPGHAITAKGNNANVCGFKLVRK